MWRRLQMRHGTCWIDKLRSCHVGGPFCLGLQSRLLEMAMAAEDMRFGASCCSGMRVSSGDARHTTRSGTLWMGYRCSLVTPSGAALPNSAQLPHVLQCWRIECLDCFYSRHPFINLLPSVPRPKVLASGFYMYDDLVNTFYSVSRT